MKYREILLLQPECGLKVARALDQLFVKDAYLFEVDANERTITGCFADYLKQQFSGCYDVDREYNRDRHDVKRLRSKVVSISSDDDEARTVFPDVIVHRRGTDENYLVIECKKFKSRGKREEDLEKLSLFVSQLHYEYALYIEFLDRRLEECGYVNHIEWIPSDTWPQQ